MHARILLEASILLQCVRGALTFDGWNLRGGPFPHDLLGELIGLPISLPLVPGVLSIASALRDLWPGKHARRRCRERMLKIADSAPVFLWVTDPNGACVYNNRRMLDFCGRTLEQQQGDGWLETVHPDDIGRYRDLTMAACAARREFAIEIRVRHFDGAYRWLVRAGAPHYHANGTFAGYVGSGVDITDRKVAEQELREGRDELALRMEERTARLAIVHERLSQEVSGRQRSDEALRRSEDQVQRSERLATIGTLAAGIAHEINNPVASILAAAQLALVRELEAGRGVEDLLRKIVHEAMRCGLVVKSVLQFAREEKNERWPNDLNEVARRARDLAREGAAAHGALVDMQLCAGLPPVVMNPLQMEQVIVNLIQNACQVGGAGRHVVVRTERLSNAVSLTVHDDGPGIPEDTRSRIFDPFYTTRQSVGGTGLGLSIVHGIVEEHGGTVDVQSDRRMGTTIRVMLPVSPERASG